MSNTPRGAPELALSQAVPETTVNEQIRRTEAGASHFPIADRVTAPPGSCTDGACYIIIATATGAFAGKEGQIAQAVGTNAASGWYYRVLGTMDEGVTGYVQDENALYRWSGTAWAIPTGSGSGDLLSTNNLSDVANAGTSRTNLGATTVGSGVFTVANPSAITFLRVNADNSVSLLNASSFRTAIGAGTGSGSGDLVAANNLSDVANAGTARTNLGLAIGTNVQAYDAELAAIAGLTSAAGKVPYFTGSGTAGVTDSTSYGRGLLNAADGDGIKPTESFILACGDETTAITTGTAKVTFRIPYAFTVTAVRASVNTASTGSTILIDINEAGVTILSTKLMIDATEKTSTTAATPYVISDASLADDAEISIDFDQVGSTVAGAGVKVVIIGHRT